MTSTNKRSLGLAQADTRVLIKYQGLQGESTVWEILARRKKVSNPSWAGCRIMPLRGRLPNPGGTISPVGYWDKALEYRERILMSFFRTS